MYNDNRFFPQDISWDLTFGFLDYWEQYSGQSHAGWAADAHLSCPM